MKYITVFFLPLQYVNMYRDHRQKVVQAALNLEDAMESQRLEHYRELQSQATDLREQLHEVTRFSIYRYSYCEVGFVSILVETAK